MTRNVLIGFAVLLGFAVNAVAEEPPYRPTLGLQFYKPDVDVASAYGLKESRGAIVAALTDDSTAKAAGIDLGDLIVAIHGHEIRDINQIVNAIAAANIGETLPVTIIRDGKQMTLNVALGKLQLLKLPPCASYADIPPVITSGTIEHIYGKDLRSMNMTQLGQIIHEPDRCKTPETDTANKLVQIRRLAEQATDDERKRARVILDGNKAAISARVERERKITACREKAC